MALLPKASNQFIKAKQEGRALPKSQNQFTTGKREKHDPATIDKMRAERAAQIAEEIMEDKEATRDQRLAAAKVLMPFGKSTYSSISDQPLNKWDEMSEEEILGMAQALITSHPGLIKQLNLAPKPVEAVQQSGESLHKEGTQAA